MITSALWLVYGRFLQRLKSPSFRASAASLAIHSTFGDHARLLGKAEILNAHLGRHSYVSGAFVGNAKIGNFCSIGVGAKVGGLGLHPSHMLSTHPIFYSPYQQTGISFSKKNVFEEIKRTTVGHDVWIGANAIIMDGLTLGNGVIVAAGAVVTKDVSDYAIVGGVPAKLIRHRFSPEDIDLLHQCRWWDKDDHTLAAAAEIFRSGTPQQLFDHFNA